jgi:hypothetical protein
MFAYIVYVLLLAASAVVIARSRFFKLTHIPTAWMLGGFAIKILVGFVFYWTYSSHYSTNQIPPDAIRYVNDARILSELLPDHPQVFSALFFGYSIDDPLYDALSHQLIGWQSGYLYGLTNDCSTIIRLNVPIAFLSHGLFHLHALVFSFLSFLGTIWLFKAFAPLIRSQQERWLWALLFLMPTPLFWTSAPTKEAALMPIFGGLMYLLSMWTQGQWSRRHLWYLIPILPGLIFIKQYVLFALLPGLLFWTLTRLLKTTRYTWIWIGTILLCGIIAQHAHYFFIGGDFLYVVHKKLTDFTNVARLQQAGSFVHVPSTQSIDQFLLHFPEAFSLTYLRPYPWELKSWVYLPFILENLLTCFVLLRTITHFKWPLLSHRPMVWMVATAVLTLAAILGNTVPIMGAIIRYRTPGLMLLFGFCLMCAAMPTWKARINKH